MLIALTFAVALLRRCIAAAAHAPRHHPLDEQPKFAVDVRDAWGSFAQLCGESLHPQVEGLDNVGVS